MTPQVTILEMFYGVMKNFNYLVVDPATRRAVIVDPAWQMDKVDRALEDTDSTLEGILITHSHPDHINLAKAVAARYACPIWMSPEEIAVSGFQAEHLVPIEYAPWSVGEMNIRPIATPGHTPGCVCYQIGDNLFTGDVLFAEGCGICPDIQGAYDMFESLEYLKAELGGDTRIFPGHSYGKPPGQTMSQLLRDNIYLQFRDRNTFAAFRLRKGQNRSKMFNFS